MDPSGQLWRPLKGGAKRRKRQTNHLVIKIHKLKLTDLHKRSTIKPLNLPATCCPNVTLHEHCIHLTHTEALLYTHTLKAALVRSRSSSAKMISAYCTVGRFILHFLIMSLSQCHVIIIIIIMLCSSRGNVIDGSAKFMSKEKASPC